MVVILSSTYFLMHLDLLKCLYTFYFWIAETQSWKPAGKIPSFKIQTIPASKTRKYYLQNCGKKSPKCKYRNTQYISSAWALFSSILHIAFTLPLFVILPLLEILRNLLARCMYAWAMSCWIFYQKILWLTTRKTYWLLW